MLWRLEGGKTQRSPKAERFYLLLTCMSWTPESTTERSFFSRQARKETGNSRKPPRLSSRQCGDSTPLPVLRQKPVDSDRGNLKIFADSEMPRALAVTLPHSSPIDSFTHTHAPPSSRACRFISQPRFSLLYCQKCLLLDLPTCRWNAQRATHAKT